MTSERKIAANRQNGRRSHGPRTSAGKSRASRNALRHGLSTIGADNPMFRTEIGDRAKLICGDHVSKGLFEQALVIAECDLILRCVQTEFVQLIERLRDPMLIPLARKDNSLTLAQWRLTAAQKACDQVEAFRAQLPEEARLPKHKAEDYQNPHADKFEASRALDFLLPEANVQSTTQAKNKRRPPKRKKVAAAEVTPAPIVRSEPRDDCSALRLAIPDLSRLERYWRRAKSRRKAAILRFADLKTAVSGSAGLAAKTA